MSHFVVMVIGDDPESQLDPFNEQPEDDSPLLVFVDQTEEVTKAYAEEGTEVFMRADGTWVLPWKMTEQDEQIARLASEDENSQDPRLFVQMPFNQMYSTFEEFVKDWHGLSPDRIGYSHNPNAKWDWYQLGGRWRGYFKLKDKAPGVLGEAGVFNNEPSYDCDQATKGEIDFEGMMNDAYTSAGQRWDKVIQIIGEENIKNHRTWEDIRSKHDGSIQEIDALRNEYHAQPSMKAIREYNENNPDDRFGLFMSIDEFKLPRHEYCKKQSIMSVTPFAVLKDGQWYERGSMGWWGCVSDEKDALEWATKVVELLESIPDDTLLSIYDCHI